jgi:hypothetical protein
MRRRQATVQRHLSDSTWLCAIGGSLIVLLIWGFITGRSKSKSA